MRDYYEILGVDKAATDDAIKKAYRKLAMQYHPDRNQGDDQAEEKFKEVTEAYEVLRNPSKRQRYDRYGHAGLKGGAGGLGVDFDLSDALRTFMSEGFGDFFGMGRGGRRSGVRRGNDLQVRLKLTLEEVATGVEKKIKLKKFVACEVCSGTGASAKDGYVTCLQCQGAGEVRQVSQSLFGQFVNIATCPRCHGEGKIVKNPCSVCSGEGRVEGISVVSVDVPAGVTSGNYMTVRGEGNAAPRGGENGDVIVLIEEAEHDYFERHGDDVLYDLPLSFAQVVLGAEVEVPTLNGKAKLHVQAGTQSHKILRMRNKGLPHLRGGGRGDQLVRVLVWTPNKLTPETRGLIQTLGDGGDIDPPEADTSFFDRVKEAIF